MKKLLLPLLIPAILSAPAYALEKSEQDQMTKALTACASNISNPRKTQRSVKALGLDDVGTVAEITSFAPASENFFVAVSDPSFQHNLCLAAGKGMSLRQTNALAAAFAKSLGASPTETDDADISKIWSTTRGNKPLLVMVEKSKDTGEFSAPAISILIVNQ